MKVLLFFFRNHFLSFCQKLDLLVTFSDMKQAFKVEMWLLEREWKCGFWRGNSHRNHRTFKCDSYRAMSVRMLHQDPLDHNHYLQIKNDRIEMLL